MNVGIGTKAADFLFREYINSIFGTVLDRHKLGHSLPYVFPIFNFDHEFFKWAQITIRRNADFNEKFR